MVAPILYLCFIFLIFVVPSLRWLAYLIVFLLGSSYVLLVVAIVYLRQVYNLHNYNNKVIAQRKSLVAMAMMWSASELFCEPQVREVVWWLSQTECLKVNSFMLLKFNRLKSDYACLLVFRPRFCIIFLKEASPRSQLHLLIAV